MPLKLPDFLNPTITHISICATIDDEEAISFYADNEKEFDGDGKYGDDHWLHVSIAIGRHRDRKLHLHVDAVRSMDDYKAPPTSTIERMRAELERLYGKTAKGWLLARAKIPKSQLPKSGIVLAMSGISTSAAGEKLSLTGARMSFEGSQFDELEWRVAEDNALIYLDAFKKDMLIDDDFLIVSGAFLTNGIRRLVLEKEEVSQE